GVRLAPETTDDEVELFFAQAEGRGARPQARLGGAVPLHASHAAAPARASSSEPSTTVPSAEPSSASTARSGCGIMPSTLPRSLTMPAMALRLPLTLAAAVVSPCAFT